MLNRNKNRGLLGWFFVGATVFTGCSTAQTPQSTPIFPGPAVVKVATIRATGCGPVAKIGAGFAVGPGIFATVAHTLRGAQEILLEKDRVDLVYLDHRTDIALLKVPAIKPAASQATAGSAVSFAKPQIGPAKILRRPNGADRTSFAEIQVNKVAKINIEEPIDNVTYHRDGFVAGLEQATVSVGDSGSPVVDAAGAIIGMVFATDSETSRTAYAVSSLELQQALNTNLSPIGTGTCTD